MGQLSMSLKPSRLTNFFCNRFFLMNLLLSVIVNAQNEGNCFFDTNKLNQTVTPWVIEGDIISEKTSPGEAIWNVTTSNIESSQSLYHPHAKYLSGLRYTSRYVYRTSTSFPDFVNTQNCNVVSRLVKFECKDGSDVTVLFKFPLSDVNDPPEFLEVPRKELRVASDYDDVINKDDPIVAFDKDFDDKFNNVVVTTDRPEELLVEISREEVLPEGIGKKFYISLKLNLREGNVIAPGRYSFNLFASDGQFTASAALRIDITSNSLIS